MFVNTEWKYREVIENIEAIKSNYKDILASFLWYEVGKRVECGYNLKRQIYSLKFEEWKKDKIWEYINDYEEFETLLKFI